jgi:hypothetical protein
MSAIRNIREKSGASPQTARVTAPDAQDSEPVAPAADEAAMDGDTPHAPPPGMGLLVDRTV